MSNMITRSSARGKIIPLWQRQMSEAFVSSRALLKYLQIDESGFEGDLDEHPDFPLRVPYPFAERMKKGDEDDPLLKQVISLRRELLDTPGYSKDPLLETQITNDPGILQKYHGRTLLVTTGACAVHCRYCFRRHFPYTDSGARKENLARLWQLPKEHSEEIILSGGDPLSLSDSRLSTLLHQLDKTSALKRLRIHTRLPVILPDRVTDELCRILSQFRSPVVMVLHINHPNELDEQCKLAFMKLKDAGVHLLNQAVLLRDINDQAEILEELSTKCFAMGILPYYLHQLDPVQGSAHFQVDDREAIALIEALRKRLPGYLLPRLVREVAEESSKTPVANSC